MTAPDERTYTATAAAELLGCSTSTVAHYARRVLGRQIQSRPGRPCRFTAEQLEQVQTTIDEHRAKEPYRRWMKPTPKPDP